MNRNPSSLSPLVDKQEFDLQKYLSTLNHEIRQPLSTIISLTELLQDELSHKLSTEHQELLKRLSNSSYRLDELICHLKSNTRHNEKQHQAVDLNLILKNVLDDLASSIIQYRANIEYGPLPIVYGHPTELRQLFSNLISNALKYHRPGIPPQIRIFSPSQNHESPARICVRDNGIGIPPELREKVFEDFERGDCPHHIEGNGLGLALCKRIIKSHQGDIQIGSVSTGTLLEITLPQA